MNLNAILIVFRKEVLDLIRDRRTLIFMIVLPLLLVPGIFYLMSSFTISSEKEIASRSSSVAIIGHESAPELTDYFTTEEKQIWEAPENFEEDVTAFLVERNSGKNAFLDIRTDIDSVEQAQQMIRNEELQAAIVIPEGFGRMLQETEVAEDGENAQSYADTGLSLRVEYLSTDDHSEKAWDRIRESLRAYKEQIIDRRLASVGQNRALIEPWETSRTDLATQQERMGEILGSLLPYMIILMTFGGATFPAIQLGAGEKEQKTLETLLTSAVSRADMVTGKFLTILITGIVSAALSLVGMWYAFSQMGNTTGLADMFSLQVDTGSILLALGLIIPLALVFAAVLLTLSVLAKSYREAQGYIGPLNMLVILPAFASLLPGVKLNYVLSMVPIVNVSLVLRQILSGKAAEVLPFYATTIVSTLVLAGLAIAFCAYMFTKESTVFKD